MSITIFYRICEKYLVVRQIYKSGNNCNKGARPRFQINLPLAQVRFCSCCKIYIFVLPHIFLFKKTSTEPSDGMIKTCISRWLSSFADYISIRDGLYALQREPIPNSLVLVLNEFHSDALSRVLI